MSQYAARAGVTLILLADILWRHEWASVATLAVLLAMFAWLDWISGMTSEQASIEELEERLDAVVERLDAVVERLKHQGDLQETMTKQAEHIQKLISQSNLATAFQRK
jgi:membrane protein implicated in regulation of membrane protease activity